MPLSSTLALLCVRNQFRRRGFYANIQITASILNPCKFEGFFIYLVTNFFTFYMCNDLYVLITTYSVLKFVTNGRTLGRARCMCVCLCVWERLGEWKVLFGKNLAEHSGNFIQIS